MDESDLSAIREFPRSEWPVLLKEVPDAARPRTLYIKGTPPPRDALIVGIVGSRHPTAYGKDVTKTIATLLASRGIIIVSGLAIGVDGVAHQAAIDAGGRTIAVLGSGLDDSVLYPAMHRTLAGRIIETNGALFSEYAPYAKAAQWTFPERNRIIAGMAHAVVLTEAQERSGARITAKYALEYGRDVFAVPGPITSELSLGTNQLIRDGAIPVTAPEDILTALGIAEIPSPEERSYAECSPVALLILESLRAPLTLDEIAVRVPQEFSALLGAISELELHGMIQSEGNHYRKR
jgi:DNA processing protein